MKNRRKILLLISLMGLLLSCGKRAEKQITYLPEGLEKGFFIVYDYKDGTPMEYNKKGERVYRIPENGILYTQFSVNYGWEKPKIFYVDSIGNEIKRIKGYYTEEYWNRLNKNEIYYIDGYIVSFSDKTGSDRTYLKNDTIDMVTSSSDKGHIKCKYITLGTPQDDGQRLREEARSIIDSISKYYPEKYNR